MWLALNFRFLFVFPPQQRYLKVERERHKKNETNANPTLVTASLYKPSEYIILSYVERTVFCKAVKYPYDKTI